MTQRQPGATLAEPGTDRLSRPVLEVTDLAVSFDNSAGGPRVQAVNGASMALYPQQTLAVVGESGCGKSVTAMSTMQLIARPPGRFDRGSILFEGRDICTLEERDMLSIRGGKIAMIFQEPMTSLNPVYTIGDQLLEAILLHQRVGPEEARGIAVQAMRDVGIRKPEERLGMYPHQFSGGMRQRVMIAMALACRPKVLLADEPTTALDVTIQAQILELLRELQRDRDMGIMLITHNLGVVAENADVVCVMYAGRVVEVANVFELFDEPLHPYTRGLFRSIPMLREAKHRLVTIRDVTDEPAEFRRLPGAVPWWPDMPQGARPALAAGRDEHVLVEVRPDRWVACWRTPELEARPHRRPNLAFRRGDR
ncbi:MAG: ABC transporter ATP-binding protein [Planctomycetes bacterium]|nr:ABC transporter ATP-binding protein [Planctomycetota bacterium]